MFVTGYVTLISMIRSFKHKGLKRFFETGDVSGVQAQHANRLRLILGRLHAARQPKDMNLPGLRLHELKGKRAGTWAVDVSGNWRITFHFEGQDAEVVNYEDYH
jgi:proteic killer suppression protein